jgi:hypothetical protein
LRRHLPIVSKHLVRQAAMDPAGAAGAAGVPGSDAFIDALRAHPTGLASALQLIGVSQLLFGTDAPLRVSQATVQGLLDYGFSPRTACDRLRERQTVAALPRPPMTSRPTPGACREEPA